jgi:glycosyltransferase involved in cell wall biosynthesis
LLECRSTTGQTIPMFSPSDTSSAGSARPRVLHVVESLGRTAVETWLLRMLEYANRSHEPLDWTFYCIEGAGAFDESARALGAKVVLSPVRLGDKRAFLQALRTHLSRHHYDVLHCHHDLVSAVYLLAAWRLPIGRRIVHVHNADESVLTPNVMKRSLFRPTFRRICLTFADRIAANSNHSLDTFLAGRRRRPGIDNVHYYGIAPEPLTDAKADRVAFRRQLGFGVDAKIVLFAGRMVPEKNPVFAVDVIAAMRRMDPAVVGIFAGAGSLEQAVQRQAAALGLDAAVKCLGWRGDIPELMAGSDWFILPHPEHPLEGFGIAVVEAQLAGLRLLLSLGVADDPLLPTASARRLSLGLGAQAWAEAAMALWSAAPPSHRVALEAFQQSPMAMDRALRGLIALHGAGGNSDV